MALMFTRPTHATPFFARTFGMSCQTCHSGFPRLNAFGLEFKANNFRLPGAEKHPPMAWSKTLPFTAQVQPFYERFSPGAITSQFTDTQLLAGGLLTSTTAFYLHHSYFIDDKPILFPSYELWVQQVLDERTKTMLKLGQFELPYAYSPDINRTTPSLPLLFGASLENNDVVMGTPMTGVQLSSGPLEGTRAFVAFGAPSALSSGTLNSDHQFFGRFRDLFLRVATGKPDRQLGVLGYFTNPPRDPTNANSTERSSSYGLEGTLLTRIVDLQAMALYRENNNPLGNGKRGFVRSAFIEADRMLLPWLGLTGRWDIQTLVTSNGQVYTEAKTVDLRLYPYRSVKLIAEYQQLDHGRSATTLSAAITF
jgi:hypothetical protein